MIATFMVAGDHSLVEPAKQKCQIGRGRAYFTNAIRLGQFALVDDLRERTNQARPFDRKN